MPKYVSENIGPSDIKSLILQSRTLFVNIPPNDFNNPGAFDSSKAICQPRIYSDELSDHIFKYGEKLFDKKPAATKEINIFFEGWITALNSAVKQHDYVTANAIHNGLMTLYQNYSSIFSKKDHSAIHIQINNIEEYIHNQFEKSDEALEINYPVVPLWLAGHVESNYIDNDYQFNAFKSIDYQDFSNYKINLAAFKTQAGNDSDTAERMRELVRRMESVQKAIEASIKEQNAVIEKSFIITQFPIDPDNINAYIAHSRQLFIAIPEHDFTDPPAVFDPARPICALRAFSDTLTRGIMTQLATTKDIDSDYRAWLNAAEKAIEQADYLTAQAICTGLTLKQDGTLNEFSLAYSKLERIQTEINDQNINDLNLDNPTAPIVLPILTGHSKDKTYNAYESYSANLRAIQAIPGFLPFILNSQQTIRHLQAQATSMQTVEPVKTSLQQLLLGFWNGVKDKFNALLSLAAEAIQKLKENPPSLTINKPLEINHMMILMIKFLAVLLQRQQQHQSQPHKNNHLLRPLVSHLLKVTYL